MNILLAFPSFNISFFLIFVLLELDSDLSTLWNLLNFWKGTHLVFLFRQNFIFTRL